MLNLVPTFNIPSNEVCLFQLIVVHKRSLMLEFYF